MNNQSSNKKLKQYLFRTKHLKIKSKRSFQQQYQDNSQFNAYIKSQYQKMIQQKTLNPTLIIPQGFKQFINSKSFKQLLKKIYQYTDLMIQYQHKYQQTQKQQFNQNGIQLLKYQSNILSQKCKDISYVYMGILLSYGQSQCIFKDQYFFQTMIYFLAQVLRSNFQPNDFPKVQQQLNRIFRTGAFNLIKRRHQQDLILQRHPVLKQVKFQLSGINRMTKRLAIQKKHNYSMQLRYQKTNRLPKPMQITLSTFKSVHSRSPLISSYYPSQKQKLYNFGQIVRQKDTFIRSINKKRQFSKS